MKRLAATFAGALMLIAMLVVAGGVFLFYR